MAKVEIDESALQQYQSLAGFLQAGLNNPETRAQILKVQKVLNPKAHIPEIDSQAPILDEMKALRKELADDKAARVEAESKREAEAKVSAMRGKWNEGRRKVKENYALADEGVEALEKFMEENGVADHEIAYPAFEKMHPRTSPVMSNSSPFRNMMQIPEGDAGADLKLLHDSPDAWLAQTFNKDFGRQVL